MEDHAAVAQALADAAADVTMRYFRSPDLLADNKASGSEFDPVTLADREAETAMRAVLAARRPQDGILGEEFENLAGESGLTWVLDPIDGTRAFISGAPSWGTLIGLSDGTRVLHGTVSQPYIGETFTGGQAGAFLSRGDGQTPIKVRSCGALEDAILMTTFPEVGSPYERAAFENVSARVRLTRYGFDCYAYCLLAMGQIDLVIEAGLHAYDVQGPIGVIEAAGGIVTTWDGGSALNGGRILAAGDRRMHEAALDLLNS